jgi:hypothetical protein
VRLRGRKGDGDGWGVRIVCKNANGEKTSQSKDDGSDLAVFERWKPLRLGGAQLLGRYLMQGVGGPNVGCLCGRRGYRLKTAGQPQSATPGLPGLLGGIFPGCRVDLFIVSPD